MSAHKKNVRNVLVTIATFRRPEQLAILLDSLVRQDLPNSIQLSVVVVDNDPDQTAADVCSQHATRPTYVSEPRPGISAARNAGLRHLGAADAVLFIDDDEVAKPQWVSTLVSAANDFGADVVGGPVVPVLPAGVPAWYEKQGWFKRPTFPRGAVVKWPATNNSLVRAEFLQRMSNPRFDDALGLTGGEDGDFFDRARRAGALMVWSPESIVCESIPLSRVSLRWIWRRNLRLGNVSGMTLRRDHPTPVVVAIGLARVAVGLVAALPVILFRPSAASRWVAHIPRGIGTLGAVRGRLVIEYARP